MRRGANRRGPRVVPKWHAAASAIERFRRCEEHAGITSQTKLLDPRIWKKVLKFSRGASFDELKLGGFLEPGDLVRTLRLAIQLMKQTAEVFRSDNDFCKRLEHAWRNLNRDEVDAERQLRISAGIEND